MGMVSKPAVRAKELIKLIDQADEEYYNNDKPSMSDAAYDAAEDELRALASKLPAKLKDLALATVNRVGPAVPAITEWKKAAHTIPMGSLNKVNTEDEFRKWAHDCSITGNILLTEKLDGISINTIWEQGRFVQAITRGANGTIGEDITVNVKKMKGIPAKLNKPFSGSVRGEIVLLKSDLKKYFQEYKSARNAAGGIAKRYDGIGVEHLTVIMYHAAADFDTEKKQFKFLQDQGFVVPFYKVCKNIEECIREYERYEAVERDKLDYEIDGLVMRLDDMAEQLALGDMGRGPKGAIAFKFSAAAMQTILRKIIWQVGNTGRITPVAEFDPVVLLGATINRSSLYNYSYIRELGLDVDATILVVRANDVIPRVEEVIKSTGTVAKAPTKCPECGTHTILNGEYLMCPNTTGCPAQMLGRLKSWVSELNILDWSDATLQRVMDAGLVEDVADLYKLRPEQMEKLDRMGAKLAKKLCDILAQHREISLQNFIGGLGIEGVATSTSKNVVDAGYDTVDAFLGMSVRDFEAIPGFGAIRAQAFHKGLHTNRSRIKAILDAGVKIKTKPKGALTSKSFCFSGEASMPRAQLHKIVEDRGGDVKKSVGRGLDYLVLEDPSSNSSKAQAARKLGVQIIGEDDFKRMAGI